MNGKSKEAIPTRNKKKGLVDEIMAKYKECNDSCYLHIAINHLKIYEHFHKLMEAKGAAAFSTRLEYQKFEVAKLFIDRIKILQFSLDPFFKGYGEYKDKEMPPLDAFGMTPDLTETKRMKFCRSIETGDILDLKVVGEDEAEFKFLVINKYDDNERIVDYLMHAYIVKSYQLKKLPRQMKIGDYVRAAVFGKLKLEGNVFSKLLVTVNNNKVAEKNKDVKLGVILKSDIRYYPEDISKHGSFLNYMKDEKDFVDIKKMTKCMTSVGLDPYKTYSFDKAFDGKKLGKPKRFDTRTMELITMEKSMNKLKEAEKQILEGVNARLVLPLTVEALEIYPQNDAAYAIRGQLWNRIFVEENKEEYLLKAVDDCGMALELNPYNLTATRVYLNYLLLSAEYYKEDGNIEKTADIQRMLDQCKHIFDGAQLLGKGDEEDKSKLSPTGEAQVGVVPMDFSEGK